MTKKLKIGFIGGGINSAIGTTHKIASEMDGRFELVAGCFSSQKDINHQTAHRWGISLNRCYAHWQEMVSVEKNRLDAFVVLNPTPQHKEVLEMLINEGCAVICEKALTNSSHKAIQIKHALIEKNGFLAITYNYTGYHMLRELKWMIKKGVLGSIKQVMVEMPQEGFSKEGVDGKVPLPQTWRLQDLETATLSLDLGVHIHHIIHFLTGETPLRVVATQQSFGAFPLVIDNINCIADYTNDLTCNIWYCKTALGYRNGLRVRVFGDQGAAEWYQLEPENLLYCNKQGHRSIIDRGSMSAKVALDTRYNRFKAGHPVGFIEAFANLYFDIADALECYQATRTSPYFEYVFGIDEAISGLVMLEKIELSSKNGKWEFLKEHNS